ncbi:MAG TPA: SRPBCC family protein [Methylomirabilota bacterium]
MAAPAPTISITVSDVIRRPLEEVRAQFADIPYHIHANVHPELSLSLITINGRRCRFRQEVRIVGLKQVDDVMNTVLDNGDLLSEVVAGTNRGLEIHFSYAPAPPDGTLVTARFEIPNDGLKRFFGPLFAFGVRRAAQKALAQDRRDLESGRYRAYRDRAARTRPRQPIG